MRLASRLLCITNEEAVWAIWHPFKAVAAGRVRSDATPVGEQIGELFATGDPVQDERIVNAARHQYGACLLSLRKGEEYAREITEAHETNSPGSDPDDTRADRRNNEKGFRLARESRGSAERLGAESVCRGGMIANVQAGDFAR
ncbi:MAG: DUF6973 domain-containing protein [Gemmatimonadaceae bacterium]